MIFLYATGDAKKARYHLVRLTKTCNQLVRTHMKYKSNNSNLLPSGDIWPCDLSYKLAANPHCIWYITLTLRYLYCLSGFSKIFWCETVRELQRSWGSNKILLLTITSKAEGNLGLKKKKIEIVRVCYQNVRVIFLSNNTGWTYYII